ncbi:hypothetical protein Dimus_001053 [Dionaea muscipula]
MEVIKRQKWESLFKRRELVHVDVVKEFYAKLTMSHNRKKDVVRCKVRGVENEFDHQKLASILGVLGNNGIWTGENRRRDDEMAAPAEDVHEEEEGQNNFDEVDEATVQGESRSGEKFYDAEDEVQESPEVNKEAPAVTAQDSVQPKVTEATGVDSSGPSGHLLESVMNKLQAEFERARADRIQADLEKAQAENARLLALLQQAQNLPKP